MPNRLDAVALQMAAGTLPLASEVKAMEDCTVEGSMHTYSIPMHKSGPSTLFHKGMLTMPSRGKITKVLAATSP